jgi:hypothetical protein
LEANQWNRHHASAMSIHDANKSTHSRSKDQLLIRSQARALLRASQYNVCPLNLRTFPQTFPTPRRIYAVHIYSSHGRKYWNLIAEWRHPAGLHILEIIFQFANSASCRRKWGEDGWIACG